ncbi:hypothetical protein ACS0TY_032703 [Phlomoides rotata]
MDKIPEGKLPFGEWMRASLMKKASVTLDDNKKPSDNSLRRRLFDEFKQGLQVDRNVEENGNKK